MFDYGSQISTYETSGIVDYFRIPKRAYYWYRNAYAKVAPPTWPAAGTPAGLKLTASTTTLSAVDGTQDALVTVTVVDASGKAISNNVPVTLTVTSGPGEFPTGPSIIFTPPSSSDPRADIAILDGQAAIEFRTYYAGTSVITATSPGLSSATMTITSQGSPAYVPGSTPPTAPRPYVRYTGSTDAAGDEQHAGAQPSHQREQHRQRYLRAGQRRRREHGLDGFQHGHRRRGGRSPWRPTAP